MKHTDQLTELKARIERYFDCDLTDAEETMLRRELTATRLSDSVIDEARALMGLRRRRTKRINLAELVSAAACVAVILFVGIGLLRTPEEPSGSCIAWSGGSVITDEPEVIGLFFDDIATVAPLIDKCENEI